MGKVEFRARKVGGFSLIEVMIAGGLVAFLAVALLPAVFSVADSSKASGFKAQCSALVRAKLQEYLNGVADQSLGTGYTPSGFEYTKKRFQTYGSSCSLTPPTGAPGFREAVYTNAVNPTVELAGDGTPALSRELLGFQLWVMIRQYNPRTLVSGQPSRECPTNFSTYQFFRLGDALEVTVTGMIRVRPAIAAGGRGGAKLGKLDDVDANTPHNSLTCSATELVYPPRLPFRYYLSTDGKILNLQAKLAMSSGLPGATAEATEAHFRSIWTNTGGAAVSSIRSFAVSPDNRWVWVMRPGELSRYGPCYETPTTVTVNGVPTAVGGTATVNGQTFQGMPDCPSMPSRSSISLAPGPDGLVWSSEGAVENITVDFRSLTDHTDDLVYGFPNSGSLRISGHATDQGGVFRANISTGTAVWSESTDFFLPSNRPRIRGMFIAQTFPSVTAPNLFFFDNSCYVGNTSGDTTDYRYCTSLYSSADTNMQQEMREVPVQVEAISY